MELGNHHHQLLLTHCRTKASPIVRHSIQLFAFHLPSLPSLLFVQVRPSTLLVVALSFKQGNHLHQIVMSAYHISLIVPKLVCYQIFNCLNRYAAANDVALMTFDNEAELHKTKDLYPNAKLVIRIRVDDSKSLCQVSMFYVNKLVVCSLRPSERYYLNTRLYKLFRR